MTIEDFRNKRQNIEKTHPAPEGLSVNERLRFYSKIIQKWIDELENISDVKIAQKEERNLNTKSL
ncbi:MAG: hypothetical protein KBA33_09935 [Cloacibacterium sp.]|nr:hypothetical protein [Cloacibacterium sp.]